MEDKHLVSHYAQPSAGLQKPHSLPSLYLLPANHPVPMPLTQGALPHSLFPNLVYKLAVQETTQHILTVNLRWGAGLKQILCVAGNPATKDVFALEVATRQLTQLDPLHTAREAYGVTKARNCEYVFGGLGDSQYLC